jgi:hypothetical protein
MLLRLSTLLNTVIPVEKIASGHIQLVEIMRSDAAGGEHFCGTIPRKVLVPY